jgi:hypothetical protein
MRIPTCEVISDLEVAREKLSPLSPCMRDDGSYHKVTKQTAYTYLKKNSDRKIRIWRHLNWAETDTPIIIRTLHNEVRPGGPLLP